jgi:molybdopterin molybdotransferase
MAFGLLPQYTSNFDVDLDPSSQAHPHSHAHSPRMIPVFGLPGNPVAVMVTFMIFVKAALQKMQGAISNCPRLISAISSSAIRKKPGRTEYQRAFISLENQQNYVKLIGNQGSATLLFSPC